MDLIKRLEIYRLDNKITQQELADKLDVAFATVNRWLNGKTKPNKIQSYHIRKLLDKSEIKAPRRKKGSNTLSSKR